MSTYFHRCIKRVITRTRFQYYNSFCTHSFPIEYFNSATIKQKTNQTIWNSKLHNYIETTRNSSELWKNVNRMWLGGMNEHTENTDKLATGLQNIVIGATADNALLASYVAVSF